MAKKRRLVVDMKYHYTYRITNIKEGMYYYGVHSCDCLPKEDIGVKYWSSLKKKEFIKDQKQNPQDYKYKVIKIFSTRVEAIEHEIFLHKKFDVKLHKKFYNEANQTSTKFDTSGKGIFINEFGEYELVDINEAKIRGLKGRPCEENTKKELSNLYKGKTIEELYGIEKANEMKIALSKALTGKKEVTILN